MFKIDCRIFLLTGLFLVTVVPSFAWGFYAHQKINFYAVFLLPPQMMVLYKSQINFLFEHAVDPDKRRYAVEAEGPRHYIDLDRYGQYPFDSLPKKWEDAVMKFTEDSINKHGIVPWWIDIMQRRLIKAFREKDQLKILKLSAELGHYISDAHVPLHTSSNHNGQFTNQRGIHGFWESRLPELLAEKEWSFWLDKAEYIKNITSFIWKRVMESAAAVDTVLKFEKQLSNEFPEDQKYAFEDRKGKIIKQYSSAYSIAYDKMMAGMVERRMQQSIYAIACFWLTAWIDAGQPDLATLVNKEITEAELIEYEKLTEAWRNREMIGRKEDE